MTAKLFSIITTIIATGGYPALLLLTLLDSTVLPVPNEAIMPFAGFLIQQGRFDFLVVVIISMIGGVLGALTSYAIGYYGTEPFVARWGKYVRLSMEDVKKVHAFFEKYGERVILVSRFIPLVRQFISIPAGAAQMNITKFCVYTAIGSGLWNSAILFLGYTFGVNSPRLKQYTAFLDFALLAVAMIGILWLAWRKNNHTS